MVELIYKDAYGIKRSVSYENFDGFLQSLAGCLVIPDYYQVEKVLHQGQDLGYRGKIGDLYQAMLKLDIKH